MPVVVKTGESGQELYAAAGYMDDEAAKKKREKDKKALFGEE